MNNNIKRVIKRVGMGYQSHSNQHMIKKSYLPLHQGVMDRIEKILKKK